jgi:hypothetical protein
VPHGGLRYLQPGQTSMVDHLSLPSPSACRAKPRHDNRAAADGRRRSLREFLREHRSSSVDPHASICLVARLRALDSTERRRSDEDRDVSRSRGLSVENPKLMGPKENRFRVGRLFPHRRRPAEGGSPFGGSPCREERPHYSSRAGTPRSISTYAISGCESPRRLTL